MIFNGYPPSTVGIAVVALLVFVAILYLLRVRRRRVEVSSIGLWRELLDSSRKRRWHDWIRRLLSFLLCALIVGLIALALIDPREEIDTDAHRHTVYIFDASGSMAAAATPDQQSMHKCTTRLECAKNAAKEQIAKMRPDERALIIEASGMIRAVSGPFQADTSALIRSIDDIQPRSSSLDLDTAIAQAQHLLRDKEKPQIVLLTDGQFDIDGDSIDSKNNINDNINDSTNDNISDNTNNNINDNINNNTNDNVRDDVDNVESESDNVDVNLAFRNIPIVQMTFGTETDAGEPAHDLHNIAINAFNARRYIANRLAFEVFAKITNASKIPVTADLTIYALGKDDAVYDPTKTYPVLATKRLTLASGDSEVRIYDDLPIESARLAAKVSIVAPDDAVDALALDDVAYALIPDYTSPKILLLTPGNLYLEAALLLNENYRVTVAKPSSAQWHNDRGEIDLVRAAREYDVVIVDNSYRNLPKVASEGAVGNIVWIAPPAENAPWKQSLVKNPVVERVNVKHSVAKWLALRNLNIESSAIYRGVSSSDIVIRSIEGPIVATRERGDLREIAIGFSLVESDIIFRIALPVLFINAIDWFMYAKAEPDRGYETARAWHIDVDAKATHVDVVRPDGTTVAGIPVYDKSIAFYGEDAGFYKIVAKSDGGESVGERSFAANFAQSDESNLNRAARDISRGVPELRDDGDEAKESIGVIATILEVLPEKSRYLWVFALIVAFILLAIEWALYHRRVTV